VKDFNMQEITIERLDHYCSGALRGLDLGSSASLAYPYLQDSNPTNNAYSSSMHTFENALSWIFYEWHRSQDSKAIAEAVKFMVHRIADVNKLAVNGGLRRLHDIFMLQTAILSGSRSVMHEAADLAGSYDPTARKPHAYEWGLVGIYKGAIWGDLKEMEQGFALFASSRPSPPHRMPGAALVKAFVEGDFKKVASSVKGVWKRDWERLEQKEKGVIERTPDAIRVNFRLRYPDNLWPWPEAAFLKLAVMRGEKMPSDPLWCPDAFLRATAQ